MTKKTDAIKIGIDLGGTKTELIVLTQSSAAEPQQVLWRKRMPSVRLENNNMEQAYQHTLMQIARLLEDAQHAHPEIRDVPVGVGTPGSENSRGLLRNCNSVYLNGRPFAVDLANHLQRPVRLANDANCFALAEAVMGAGQGARSVFGVILGTGVGGGLVFDGRLQIGANHIAGEWGHNPAAQRPVGPARLCYCGRADCNEVWLSGPALSQSYAAQSGVTLSAVDIHRRRTEGDAQAEAVWDAYCQSLAASLAQVINVVDPERVVLGGGVSNVADLYERIPRYWKNHIFSDEISTQLLQAQLGDSAGVYGAAWLW